MSDVLTLIESLVQAGVSIHWLKERSKAPVEAAWSTAKVQTIVDLRQSYRTGFNVGVRLGEPSRIGSLYLYLLDLDVRVAEEVEEARDKLRELLPEFEQLPTVKSGSGGPSRHYYFLSPVKVRSKKLAHSGRKFTGSDGRQHWTFEIELFGTGKQAVLPPSIHPDTGNPYLWEWDLDFDLVEMGLGPVVPAATLLQWVGEFGEVGASTEEDDDEDLGDYLHTLPMDLTREQIHTTLYDLPKDAFCDDRDGWLTVGMCLHHQFQGSQEGLNLWNEFSSRSEKYDAKDQGRVWKSFDISKKSMRFAVLLRAAADARLQAELSDDEDGFDEEDEDDEDILGPATAGDDDDDILGPASPPSDKPKPALEWTSLLDRNEEGAIKPTLPNLVLIVRNDPRTAGIVCFNQLTLEVVQRGKPGRKAVNKRRAKPTKQLDGTMWVLKDPQNGDLWTESKDHALRDMIESPTSQGGYGIKVSDRDMRAAVDIVAAESAFHPIREYLAGMTWDGVKRLDSLYVDFLGASDTPYNRAVSRTALVAAVARVMTPGHKFDFATILEGLQGKGKSTFIEILGKSWFSELDGDFHDQKQMIELMQGSWIMEIPELTGFSRADVRSIKAFISRKHDKARLAYAKRAQIYARQCIFIGSTNDREYLRDDTGGRRFWPVVCAVEQIDLNGFRAVVDQVWAEAVVAYQEMRAEHGEGADLPLYLTDARARDEAVKAQEDRRVESVEDGVAGAIAEWLDTPLSQGNGFDSDDEDEDVLGATAVEMRNETCLMEIWEICLGRDLASYSQIQAQQLGRAMQKVGGWSSIGQTRLPKYGKQRVFRRNGSIHIR